LVFPTKVNGRAFGHAQIFIAAPMEDGFLTFGVRAGTNDERELDKIGLGTFLFLKPEDGSEAGSQRAACFGERKTFSFKFIMVASFLKENAPHVFQITETGSKSKNRMDRWQLWRQETPAQHAQYAEAPTLDDQDPIGRRLAAVIDL
jgi:hypothetical protein